MDKNFNSIKEFCNNNGDNSNNYKYELISIDNYDQSNKYQFFIFKNCIISNSIKNNQIWEPHMHNIFEKYINKNSVVIEGGCHIGTHSLKIASLCKHLYAFEPMPESNKLLNMNIKINQLDNVTTYLSGLSDKIGETKFAWCINGNPGGAGLDNNPVGIPNWASPIGERINVKLTTIDELNLDQLDFIKLDVEGYETLVIKGALKTIYKFKPIITMEIWSNHYGGINFNYAKYTFMNLLNVGYKIEHIGGPDFLFVPL
jgi:FkbM family methyltransferase